MRISDWSSDVCSSDLPRIARIGGQHLALVDQIQDREAAGDLDRAGNLPDLHLLRGLRERGGQRIGLDPAEIAADRLGRSFGILSEIFERLLALLDFIHQPLRIARNLVEPVGGGAEERSEEHTYELKSLMRNS